VNTDGPKPCLCVGGSALSMRLCHRFSEDLGFFTYKDKFDKARIFDFFRGKSYQLINDSRDQTDLTIEAVKLSFFNARWNFRKPEKFSGFNVASLNRHFIEKLKSS